MNKIPQDHRKCIYLRRIKGNTKCIKDKNYQRCWYYNRANQVCYNFKLKEY